MLVSFPYALGPLPMHGSLFTTKTLVCTNDFLYGCEKAG